MGQVSASFPLPASYSWGIGQVAPGMDVAYVVRFKPDARQKRGARAMGPDLQIHGEVWSENGIFVDLVPPDVPPFKGDTEYN